MDSLGSSLVTWIAFLRYSLRVLRKVKKTDSGGENPQNADGLAERIEADWRRIYAQLAVVRDAGVRVSRDLTQLAQEFDSVSP